MDSVDPRNSSVASATGLSQCDKELSVPAPPESTGRPLRRDWLERLLAGKLGGLRPRRGAKIWLLVTLEAWLRTVFRG